MTLAALDWPYAMRGSYVLPSYTRSNSGSSIFYFFDTTLTYLEVDILEIHTAVPNSGAGYDYNGRRRTSGLDLWEQKLNQKEVGQVVDSKLALYAIHRFGPRWNHDACNGGNVVNLEYVVEALGRPTHIIQVCEIDLKESRGHIGALVLYFLDDWLDT